MIKIYVISENSRQHKIEDMRVPTEIETNEFLKLVLSHQLGPDASFPRAVYSIWDPDMQRSADHRTRF